MAAPKVQLSKERHPTCPSRCEAKSRRASFSRGMGRGVGRRQPFVWSLLRGAGPREQALAGSELYPLHPCPAGPHEPLP